MSSLAGEQRGDARRVVLDAVEHDLVEIAWLAVLPHQFAFFTSTVRTSGWRSFSMNGPVPLALRVA